MFEGGNIEECEECQYFHFGSHKLPLNTCNTLKHGQSIMSPNFQQLQQSHNSLDLSLDLHLHRHTTSLFKKALLSYFKHCLAGPLPEGDLLANGGLFRFPSSSSLEEESDRELEMLVEGNELLEEASKKKLFENFKEFHELKGLFGELLTDLGTSITTELIFLLHLILEEKLESFRKMQKQKGNQWLVPKFERFWGEEEGELEMGGQFKTFEDLSVEEVNTFVTKGVEKMATEIYFSSRLKYLSLKEVSVQVRSGVNVVDKFSSLVILVSRMVFLSLSGMAVPEEEGLLFESELSLCSPQEGVVEIPLAKKIKQ